MKSWLKSLLRRRRQYDPLITITIDTERLRKNLTYYKNITGEPVAPVLKANAYGHGLSIVARALDREHCPFFIVDSYFEAEVLRNEGVTTPLLIMGYTPIQTIIKNKLKNIEFTISSLETLRSLMMKIPFHLKVDTGMHRQGILSHEVDDATAIIKEKNLSLSGVCSHLASPDQTDQIEIWESIIKKFPDIQWKHTTATEGHSIHHTSTLMRLGLGLYMHEPVLEMKTIVTGVKKIRAGARVGYDGTYTTPRDMTIATVPVGYSEGVDRRLSNKGCVQIGGRYAPFVGRISMNMSTIAVEDTHIGDEVTIISKEKRDRNSIESMAQLCDTIPHEILVHIPVHLKRCA